MIVTRDITESKKAEARLRESEEQFRTLADSIPQLAWIAEADGAILWYNQRWYAYTGTTPEEMEVKEGWGWTKVHDPAELPRVMARFRAAIASGEPWEDTFPLRHRDGEFRWHLSRAMPVRDAQGRTVRWFGTNTDVEDSRRQAIELKAAIEARDTFLQVAAHELRTPLTSLQLRLQQMRRETEGGATPGPSDFLVRNLEVGEAQVRKLAALISELLDVSRLSMGHLPLQLESVNLCHLVREVVERFGTDAARAGCRVDVFADCRAEGKWDRLRLEQVLVNVLSNAFKYGPGQPVQIEVMADEQRARLTIRDEGIGITPEALPRIFGKFERGVSERHYGGLGLGLYVTREILGAMGGSISR